METSAKNSTIVNSLFTEVVKEMNFKLFANSIKKSRKDKKKLKKLKSLNTINNSVNNSNISHNRSNKTDSSNSNSFASNNIHELEKMKLKKNSYEKSLNKCRLFEVCKSCFCCIPDPAIIKGLGKRESENDFYSANVTDKSKCTIL